MYDIVLGKFRFFVVKNAKFAKVKCIKNWQAHNCGHLFSLLMSFQTKYGQITQLSFYERSAHARSLMNYILVILVY